MLTFPRSGRIPLRPRFPFLSSSVRPRLSWSSLRPPRVRRNGNGHPYLVENQFALPSSLRIVAWKRFYLALRPSLLNLPPEGSRNPRLVTAHCFDLRSTFLRRFLRGVVKIALLRGRPHVVGIFIKNVRRESGNSVSLKDSRPFQSSSADRQTVTRLFSPRISPPVLPFGMRCF